MYIYISIYTHDNIYSYCICMFEGTVQLWLTPCKSRWKKKKLSPQRLSKSLHRKTKWWMRCRWDSHALVIVCVLWQRYKALDGSLGAPDWFPTRQNCSAVETWQQHSSFRWLFVKTGQDCRTRWECRCSECLCLDGQCVFTVKGGLTCLGHCAHEVRNNQTDSVVKAFSAPSFDLSWTLLHPSLKVQFMLL